MAYSLRESVMRIVVAAETKSGIAGLKQFDAAVNQTASNTKAASSSMDSASAGLAKLAEAAKAPTITIRQLEATLKSLKEQMRDATGAGLESLKIQVKGIGDAIKQATTIPADEPVRNLHALRAGFEDLGRAALGEKFGLRAIAQNFALLGPQVVIAGAAVGFLIEKLIELSEKETDAEKAQKLLNTVMATSEASARGGATELKDLVSIITDNTNARDLQEKAFHKLQDLYPNAFKNMSLEKTSMEDITEAANKLTNALVRQAEIKGLEKAITDLFSNIATESVKSVAQATSSFDKFMIGFQALESGAILFPKAIQAGITSLAEKNKAENIKGFGDAINVLNVQLKNLLKTSLELNDDNLLGNATKTKSAKVAKPEKPLFPVFIKPDLQVVDDENELDSQLTDFEKKLDKKISDKFGKIPLTPHANVKPILDVDLGELLELQKILKEGVTNTVTSTFEALGTAIGKGQNAAQAAAKSILDTVGNLIEELGKSLIKYGVAKTYLDQVLKTGFSLPGVAAIAIGAGIVALGALVKAESSHFKQFAEGGIITGPTLGLIGEKGPEVVFPLNQLSKFIRGVQGNADNRLTGNVIVKGTDLAIALARTNKNQGMVS